MNTTPEQINLWRQSPSENQRLEFKEAKAQFDNRRLYEYCVALANEGGGSLLLGVSNKPPRPVVGYQSRNERLADLMRRFGICEEKSSGIDRVVQAAEVYQLPAPDFRSGFKRTIVAIYGPRSFENMERADRVRACYQHCCLRHVMGERMSNQSLRERFKLPEERAETASRIIRECTDANLIKLDNPESGSKRYARYLPFWA